MTALDTAADDTGWEDYHRQMFDLTPAPSAFIRWKRMSTGVNIARGLMGARNRAVKAWVAEHGVDTEAWPLAHPPAVLWMPHAATAACLRCTWVHGPQVLTVDDAAALAREHAEAHLHGTKHAALALAAPVRVWRR